MAHNCIVKPRATVQANLTEDQLVVMVSDMNIAEKQLVGMISEINYVGCFVSWWIDIGASRYVCYDRDMFKTYLGGKIHTPLWLLTGETRLKFTSGKTVILKDVLHTPKIKKNLVSDYLLNKVGFTQTFGADIYTLTKNNLCFYWKRVRH